MTIGLLILPIVIHQPAQIIRMSGGYDKTFRDRIHVPVAKISGH